MTKYKFTYRPQGACHHVHGLPQTLPNQVQILEIYKHCLPDRKETSESIQRSECLNLQLQSQELYRKNYSKPGQICMFSHYIQQEQMDCHQQILHDPAKCKQRIYQVPSLSNHPYKSSIQIILTICGRWYRYSTGSLFTSLQVYACSAVHSDCEVGFERARIMGFCASYKVGIRFYSQFHVDRQSARKRFQNLC